MTTRYSTATSIDGYIADEDGSLEWLFQFEESEDQADDLAAFVAGVGAVAMGSTTYEWLLAHEDLLEDPERWPYEHPTWVFSSRDLPAVAGADVRFVSGDVSPVHADMVAAADGDFVWIVGGGDLAGQFYDAGLLDEVVLAVAPVTLASGAPLLPRRITDPPLRLLEVDRSGDALVVLTYEVQRADAA